jgi:hypothetical protein
VRILGGGGIGMCRNPDDDGTETTLPVLAVSEESSCLDSRIAYPSSFQDFADLESDIVPNLVEPCVEHAMHGFGRGRSVSTLGDREGIGMEVGAVEKLRKVERDTVVVGNSFVVRYNVWGDSSGGRVHVV